MYEYVDIEIENGELCLARLSVVRENMHRNLCGSSTRNPAPNMSLQKNKTNNIFVGSASILISALTFNPLNNRQNGLHLQLSAFRTHS